MKKLLIPIFILTLIFSFICPSYAADNQKIPVLLYHHILPEWYLTDDNDFIISEENFRAHMKYLYDSGYTAITLEEMKSFLYEKTNLPEKSVLITFDDGYCSNISYAYPILKEYGFRATIFLITETLEMDPPLWKSPVVNFLEKTDMDATGDVFEYASHTHALHKCLGGESLLSKASYNEILSDTIESLKRVKNTFAYAYPHGQYSDMIIDALSITNIKMAFTVSDGFVTQDSDPYKLNRFTICRTTTVEKLQELLL